MKIYLRLFLLLLGLSLFWVPVLVVMQFGYPYYYFIDIPTLVTVMVPAFMFLFAFHKPIQIFHAIGNLGVIHTLNLDELNASLKVWRNFGILLVAWGGVYTLYKVLDMMRHISNPDMIGIVLIFSYNSTLYGILLATVFAFPAYLIVETRLTTANRLSGSYL